MANEDIVRLKGAGKEYKDERAGGSTIPSAVLGIVKNNVDPTRTGRIEVALKRLGTADQDNPSTWVTVRYLSPFFGYTPNTGSPDSHGDFVGNPNSYGFWATPPDIGSEVVCVFLNGDPNEGYYIGGVPQPGLTHMTPGIAASDNIIPNSGEAQSYGGAKRLPTTEFNNANDKQNNSLNPAKQPRPVHSYQAAIYNKQGLLRDPDRGPISSSSDRESPSRVFGMSTPGRPIYNGGYDDSSIESASKSGAPDKNFQVIGRTGGHTFVMDDGDVAGKDQLTRIRTSSGHTILMSDSAQTLFIIHANGQSYIELGKEGTIDMYSTNSVNIRTQGDLNLHADRNVNINAGKDFNVNAENVQIESEKVTNMFSGTDFAKYVKGNFTTKVDGGMSMASTGEASYASSSKTYINGPDAVNLNTGASGLTPKNIKQVTKIKHPDTLFDSQKGFASAPGKLDSITSRAPAHSPWENANKGVDAKTNLSAAANLPAPASPAVQQVNKSAPASPTSPTSPAVAATVPNVSGSSSMDKTSTNALTSQMAVNAATGPAANAVKQGAGIINANGTPTAVIGATALTPTQMATAGYIKPGMENAINASVASGKSLNESIPPNAWTGKGGVNSLGDYIDNKNAQVDATQTLLDKSKATLVQNNVISGKESVTQTGGLIMATATAGPGPVGDYLKTAAGGLGLKMPTSLSTAMPSVMNSAAGPISNLLAGGALAAGVANQLAGGLKSLGGADSLVSSMFSKLTASFKPLQAGVPQSLAASADEAASAVKAVTPDIASAASAASKSVEEAASGLNVSSMMDQAFKPIASSASSLTAMVEKAAAPGMSAIKDSISQISGAASGLTSTVGSAAESLTSKMGVDTSLASFAAKGLKTPDMSALEGAIGALGKPGSVDVKLPTVAEGTNDVTALADQSKALLGNPKIPTLKI